MTTPNWQHHSKKEQKRTLKPQALRRAKRRLKMFKLKMKFVSVKYKYGDMVTKYVLNRDNKHFPNHLDFPIS